MIYILDEDPKKTAEYLDDRSLGRMIKAIAQVLCNAHHEQSDYIDDPDYFDTNIPLEWDGFILKKTKNSEWSQWARQCRANYLYLVELALSLCRENVERFTNWVTIHDLDCETKDPREFYKKQLTIEWARDNVPDLPRVPWQVCESTRKGFGKTIVGKDVEIRTSHIPDAMSSETITPLPLFMPKKYVKYEFDDKYYPMFMLVEWNCIESYRNYYQAKLKKNLHRISNIEFAPRDGTKIIGVYSKDRSQDDEIRWAENRKCMLAGTGGGNGYFGEGWEDTYNRLVVDEPLWFEDPIIPKWTRRQKPEWLEL